LSKATAANDQASRSATPLMPLAPVVSKITANMEKVIIGPNARISRSLLASYFAKAHILVLKTWPRRRQKTMLARACQVAVGLQFSSASNHAPDLPCRPMWTGPVSVLSIRSLPPSSISAPALSRPNGCLATNQTAPRRARNRNCSRHGGSGCVTVDGQGYTLKPPFPPWSLATAEPESTRKATFFPLAGSGNFDRVF